MSDGPIAGKSRALAAIVAALLVLGAQLALVAVAGTDIPFHDQWDAEGRGLYPELRGGSASLSTVLAPHNEHRIVWTHLLNRSLFAVNGQWDPLVQLVAGAVLHAAVAGLLVWFLASGLSRGLTWILAMTVTLLSLPLAGWHNALWGFQSQVYFAVGFAVLGFGCLAKQDASVSRCVAGWLAVGASMLAMGPGLLAPVALVAFGLLRFREGTARWPNVALAGLCALGGWFLHTPVAAHVELHSVTLREFVAAFGRMLAWPHTGQPWAALVLNLPVVIVLFRRAVRKAAPTTAEDFALLLAFWGFLIAAGAAWSRGGGGEFGAGVPSRYADFMVLLPLANLGGVFTLVRTARQRWLAVAWGGFLLIGWAGLSAEVMRGIILPRARDRDAPVRLVREFQRTGDATVFAGQPRLLVPHPNPESVRSVLNDPRLKGALPPSLQPEQPLGPLSRRVRTLLGR